VVAPAPACPGPTVLDPGAERTFRRRGMACPAVIDWIVRATPTHARFPRLADRIARVRAYGPRKGRKLPDE